MHKELLLEKLRQNGKISILEAINFLKVSESTVRRLFISMEQEGIAVRTIGGIQLVSSSVPFYSYVDVENENLLQKQQIGASAANCINSGDILFFDSGTTVPHACYALAKRISSGDLSNLTIFTNSLVNMTILSPHCPVTLIGGEYRPNRRDFCGYISEESLRLLSFSKCFIGADGYDEAAGFTTTDFQTARLVQLAIARSENKYVLVDSSKFSKKSFVSHAKNDDIDFVITDSSISDTVKSTLSSKRFSLIID